MELTSRADHSRRALKPLLTPIGIFLIQSNKPLLLDVLTKTKTLEKFAVSMTTANIASRDLALSCTSCEITAHSSGMCST